ncbi:hypothetical protein E4K72_02920 [Oxalobacteraceae bacterium OM1]|nr:hypothetical protein E4K72_02920 [Oxalobacteraceae bacterium OM1]
MDTHSSHSAARPGAREAILALEPEILAAIEGTEQGAFAFEQANMKGPSHIAAIIAIDEDDQPSNMVSFHAYVEIEDADEHQVEAELRATCERLPLDGKGWRAVRLDVIDAGPLPMGG